MNDERARFRQIRTFKWDIVLAERSRDANDLAFGQRTASVGSRKQPNHLSGLLAWRRSQGNAPPRVAGFGNQQPVLAAGG